MHCAVGVLHKKDLNIDGYMERYLFDNESEYQVTEQYSFPMALGYVNQMIENGEAVFLEDYTEPLARIRAFAEEYGYKVDESGGMYKLENPNGECDYFTVGGRYSNALVDIQGNKTYTCKIKDININNPDTIPGVASFVDEVNGNDFFDYDLTDMDKIVDYGLQTGENMGEELFLTLVDIHT